MGKIQRSSVTIGLIVILAFDLTAGSAMKFMHNAVMKDEFLSDSNLNATSPCEYGQHKSIRLSAARHKFLSAFLLRLAELHLALSVVDDGQGHIACYFSNKTDISSESFTRNEEGNSWIKEGKFVSPSVDRSSTTQTSVNTNSTTTSTTTTTNTTTTNATNANLTTAYNRNAVTTDTTAKPNASGLSDSLTSQPLTEKSEASTTQLQSETLPPTTTRSTAQTAGGLEDCSVVAVEGCLFKGGKTTYWNSKGACQKGGGALFFAKTQEEFGQLQDFLQNNWNSGTQFSETMLVGIYSQVWTDGLDFSLTPLISHWKGSKLPDLQKPCSVVVYFSGTIALDAIDCGQEYPPLCAKGKL
ncbi:uncharacterized protein [Macrobrachium rosenbergii]|uniref:uncharacterized protein n=1 Tax=Macrobrachium rosenbergii TaxID=79674 RepID=UPI0034D78098